MEAFYSRYRGDGYTDATDFFVDVASLSKKVYAYSERIILSYLVRVYERITEKPSNEMDIFSFHNGVAQIFIIKFIQHDVCEFQF